ncbi:MAG: putative SAM-dependent methyltransferase [Rhodospirillales bacterium]|nr:putative SAM-dependent methyltransferase [Rhodospirillales bacterium]
MNDPLGVPSPWVRRFAHLVPKGGAVLDLAAGAGRHARFFAGRGHPVAAVDRNLDGMADLAENGPIERIRADLEDGSPWPLGDRQFAGIVVANYLHRPLLPMLAGALAPDGVLIYETFAVGQGEFGRPSSENYLLRPNELLRVFEPTLTIVGFEHGIDYSPGPKAVQRLAAVKGRDLVPL